MSSNYSTIQQHEPLRVPAGWGTQEKRFIAQLEETFDDIYRRFGRLRLEDMSESLQKEFRGVNELGEELATEITARENGINVLTIKTGINNLGQNETLFSRLQTDEQSYALTFQKIGASGYTATGITTISEDGITVTNSNIRTKTVMSADGFKIFDTAVTPNKFIGGIISVGGNIRMACDALYDADYPDYLMDVGRLSGLVSGTYVYGTTYRYLNNIGGVIGVVVDEGIQQVDNFEVQTLYLPLSLRSRFANVSINGGKSVAISANSGTNRTLVSLMNTGDILFNFKVNGQNVSVLMSDIYNRLFS